MSTAMFSGSAALGAGGGTLTSSACPGATVSDFFTGRPSTSTRPSPVSAATRLRDSPSLPAT